MGPWIKTPLSSTKWSPWLDWCWCSCSNSWVTFQQVPRDLTIYFVFVYVLLFCFVLFCFCFLVSHARRRSGPWINISYCYRVTSCTGSMGSQDSLYKGQTEKLLLCCQKPYRQISLVITIQKKYSLTQIYDEVSLHNCAFFYRKIT